MEVSRRSNFRVVLVGLCNASSPVIFRVSQPVTEGGGRECLVLVIPDTAACSKKTKTTGETRE